MGDLQQHMDRCPHVAAIERLYVHDETAATLVTNPMDSVFSPYKDSAKRGLLLGEIRARICAGECDGPVDGVCPIVEKKANSISRTSLVKAGNAIVRVITRNRG